MTAIDVYAAKVVAEAPPLSPVQRDAILAAFAKLRPARKRQAA